MTGETIATSATSAEEIREALRLLRLARKHLLASGQATRTRRRLAATIVSAICALRHAERMDSEEARSEAREPRPPRPRTHLNMLQQARDRAEAETTRNRDRLTRP